MNSVDVLGGLVLHCQAKAAVRCNVHMLYHHPAHCPLGLTHKAACLPAMQWSLRARCAACPAPLLLFRRLPAPLLACCYASRLRRQPAKEQRKPDAHCWQAQRGRWRHCACLCPDVAVCYGLVTASECYDMIVCPHPPSRFAYRKGWVFATWLCVTAWFGWLCPR